MLQRGKKVSIFFSAACFWLWCTKLISLRNLPCLSMRLVLVFNRICEKRASRGRQINGSSKPRSFASHHTAYADTPTIYTKINGQNTSTESDMSVCCCLFFKVGMPNAGSTFGTYINSPILLWILLPAACVCKAHDRVLWVCLLYKHSKLLCASQK